MPLVLVRLGLFRCNNNTDVYVRARGQSGRVTQRCHNSSRWETEASECEWHHAPEARGRFWEILKRSVSWDEPCLGRRRLALACSQRPLWRVPHVLGEQMKMSEWKDYASLFLCRRTFKIKGNKKFRTWTERSLCVFRISIFLCSIIGIILRWGFLIWELIFFYLLRTFCPHLGSYCVVSSFTTFRPNFTSGLLQVIYRDLG